MIDDLTGGLHEQNLVAPDGVGQDADTDRHVADLADRVEEAAATVFAPRLATVVFGDGLIDVADRDGRRVLNATDDAFEIAVKLLAIHLRVAEDEARPRPSS
jgi:hypothetical protein